MGRLGRGFLLLLLFRLALLYSPRRGDHNAAPTRPPCDHRTHPLLPPHTDILASPHP
ncbi:hypothetical protein AAW51_4564 [Caldimonas brevitalea]|uniref:Uncharacterized protein n=1 Tax=Caldimonas brevitalea TaxID=413882 RepID=A0A0G3BXK0_9BURK|nr:hypothetical protein AAW51_4564 [Caldimonas brevitalea]